MSTLAQQLQILPQTPGIYIYKDVKGNVLYVGKAKKLISRVRSYFRGSAVLDPAKQQMVKLISAIETISTDTEVEALVLEANLIRKHQPPYNVVLRDDKYYLFIKITTGEEYPRVFPVRRIGPSGGRLRQGYGAQARYFGPYSSAHAVRATLRLLRRLFPHKGEKESPRERIFPHPLFAQSHPSASPSSAPPLRKGRKGELHNTASSAPFSPLRRGSTAEGGVGVNDYLLNIQNIIRFLSGHRVEIMQTLRAGMQEASRAHEYERAATFRDQLQAIECLEGTQKVFLTTKESFDVVSLARAAHRSAANVFQMREGKLLGKHTFLLQHRAHASSTDTLRQFILQYYSVAQDTPKIIFIPETLSDQGAIARWINQATPPQLLVPQRGKKRQLLAMGKMNAAQLLQQEETNFESETRLKKAVQELFAAIGLPLDKGGRGDFSGRVETYDISNIQGQLATASMVVFEQGQPNRHQYRKFRMKLSGTPNDFAMLQETLHRRFSGRHPEWKMPDLIIIDGGKGQLSSAKKILDKLGVSVPVISLAKREEEIFVPGRPAPILLPYNSDALYLIQRMRDEAHRFTITYHRLLHSKHSVRSLLDDIPGIGPKTKKQLLRHFGSVKNIRAASKKELEKVVGTKKMKLLQDYI